MNDEDYTVTYHCKYCKKNTKQLVKEISESRFKELTKSDYIAWCVICSRGRFVARGEYRELEYTKETTAKAGGILWGALIRNEKH